MNIEEAKAAPATRLALHPDGTPMVSIGQAAPLAGLGRLAADPNHSRSVMSPAPEPAPEGLTDEELLHIWRFNFSKTNRTRFLDIARAVEAAVLARRPAPQPEPERLTVQQINDLPKHRENFICSSSNWPDEITLDGRFSRADLQQLADSISTPSRKD